MHRIAFSIGGLNIMWYSIFVMLGIIVAIILTIREAKRHHYNMEFIMNLIFYVVLFGILGARIYYVLFNLDYYLSNPIEIIQIWNGGLAIHGGIIAGAITLIIYCKRNNVDFFHILDFGVVGLIIAQAIGRWGNFFNQEAYGSLTTKAKLISLYIPKFIINGMNIDGNYYHPTFLYESLWNVIGFIILVLVRRTKKLKIGMLTAIYLIWYSIGRFFIEALRTDSLMFLNIKVAQLVSIISIVLGIVIIFTKYKSKDLYNKKC